MRFNLQFLFCLVALVACMVIAAPVPEDTVSVEAPVAVEATESSESDLERRGYSGRATWYDAGLGACGKWNSGSEKVVALPTSQYKGKCGKYVTIKNTKNGKTVKALVVDQCPGCGWGSLDLSKAAFSAIGSLSTGVLSVSWSFS